MGGISSSLAGVTDKGTLAFVGDMSLANNGGFASVRRHLDLSRAPFSAAARLNIIVQGDGKTYQIRFRTTSRWDGLAYAARFETQPNQIITYTLTPADFVATWRGQTVINTDPLEWHAVRQLGFMLSDNQPGEFGLLVHRVDWE
jgi:monofunctional biosynthetic peptidoglycan transglycosylase